MRFFNARIRFKIFKRKLGMTRIVLFFRKLFLWLALGPDTFDYMQRTLSYDRRLRRCKLADIVVRQDGRERRIEADWLKTLCTIAVKEPERLVLTPPAQPTRTEYQQAASGDERESP